MRLDRKRRRRSLIHDTLDRGDIVRLWMLRVLVTLGGHRSFIEESGFSDDGVAHAVGLGHWVDLEADAFDRKPVLAELRKLHAQAERELRDAKLPGALGPNARRLAGLIGLDETARHILEFVVTLHHTPVLDEVMGLFGNLSSARMYRIIAGVLELSEEQVKRALSSQAPLARSGLVTVDHSNTMALSYKLDLLSDTLPERMLSAAEDPLSLLREVIAPCEGPALALSDFDHVQRDLNILVPYLRQAMSQRRAGVNVFLHGSPGTGKSQLVRVLAQAFGCELYEVAREDHDGDPLTGDKRLRALRAAQSVLGTGKSLLLFDEVEDVFGDGHALWGPRSTAQTRKGWLNRMLETNPVPTLWVSNSANDLDPAFVRRFDMIVELPIPPRRQRERIVHGLCGELVPNEVVARIANADTLAPAVVERAAKVVSAIQSELPAAEWPAAMERLIGNTLTTQGHRRLSQADPSSLPGWYDPDFINADADLATLAEGLRSNPSGRLCLYGPPGTGKTAFGRWLAERLEMPLLVKRGSDLLDMYVGGTEQNIADAFREAEADGALLLIDEMDSFLQDRRGAHRSWEVTQVNEMLTQMEGFSGLLVASTNLMQGLDQAALRRFDLKLKFDYLRPAQAWRMFQQQCAALGLGRPGKPLRQPIARLTLLTPGDFAAVARQHRFRPFTSAPRLLEALAGECAVKEGAQGRAIGFI